MRVYGKLLHVHHPNVAIANFIEYSIIKVIIVLNHLGIVRICINIVLLTSYLVINKFRRFFYG